MPTYDFTLILAGLDEATEEAAEALYARFDDGTLSSSGGVAYIRFTREAASFNEAVNSAITDVRKAGLEVSKFEAEVRPGEWFPA